MRKSALVALGLVVMTLMALGLIVLTSASGAYALRFHDNDPYFFLKRQAMYCAAAFVVAFIAAKIDYHKWRDYPILPLIFYVSVFALLLAVFAFPKVNGSYRWIAVGPLRLQPSELAKLATVIAVAVWIDLSSWKVELFWRGAFWPMAIIALLALPIIKEPDFGSVMVIGAVGALIIFVGGVRLLHLLPLVAIGGGVAAFELAHNSNRVRRLLAFLFHNAETAEQVTTETMDAASYQAHMSLVAIKNGGLWGVGLGESMQKQSYLPEAHTDFIFAIGAEELGIVFSIAVILLYIAFFCISVYVARKAVDRFGRFLVIGMAFLVFFQAMFNIGVVCEALPTKGMALPFFSYGGTNLLTSFFAVGTILSVGIHSYRDSKRIIRRSVIVN